MQKMIFSIFILATLLVSFAPSIMSESKVALVANSIDIEMNPGLIAMLKENGLTVDYFGAKDKGYDAYDYIVILGGPDSSEHTGEISKKILKDADKDNLRNRKYKILYETDGFFKQGQKIFVLAGTDREYTKAAVDTYTTQVISKIKNQSSKPETSATSSIGKNLTAKELKQLIESGEDIYFIDVRNPGDYSRGHLPGAVNIPFNKLSVKLGQIPTDKKVVVYCDAGSIAASGATYLHNKGFSNVYALIDSYSILG